MSLLLYLVQKFACIVYTHPVCPASRLWDVVHDQTSVTISYLTACDGFPILWIFDGGSLIALIFCSRWKASQLNVVSPLEHLTMRFLNTLCDDVRSATMAVPQQLRHVISACVEMTAVSMQPVFGRARYQIHSVCVCVCVWSTMCRCWWVICFLSSLTAVEQGRRLRDGAMNAARLTTVDGRTDWISRLATWRHAFISQLVLEQCRKPPRTRDIETRRSKRVHENLLLHSASTELL